MKLKIASILFFSLVIFTNTNAKTFSFEVAAYDTMELRKNYSLFSEYVKNKDYVSALPFGWLVLETDPAAFAKWFFPRMEETLWYLRDSAGLSAEDVQAIQDTTPFVYDLAIKFLPDDKGYYQGRKAFILETWLESDIKEVIAAYELAIEYNPQISSYYYNRLGQLYKDNIDDSNDYKEKAIDLFTYLSEVDSENPRWNAELEGLVENIEELVDLAEKSWNFDKENLAKAWKYASLALKASLWERAIVPLNFLVEKSPTTVNYWNQLATVYNRLEDTDKAIDVYKKLIEIDSETKEHYLNLGIAYKDKGQLAMARTQYQKASEVGGNWALPIYYEGLLYETAARNCGFTFEDKLVYLLAVETYRRAVSLDGSLGMARDRISALSSTLPTQEEIFFRGLKSGQTMQISGSCYGWIGRSVKLP